MIYVVNIMLTRFYRGIPFCSTALVSNFCVCVQICRVIYLFIFLVKDKRYAAETRRKDTDVGVVKNDVHPALLSVEP